MTDVRPLRWHDLPLAYRLMGQGHSFDAQMRITVGDSGFRQALLTGTGRTNLYVLRRSGEGALGQLRFPHDAQHARLAYVSPALDVDNEDLWLSLLDGLASMAGRRGSTSITAEVPEQSPAVEVMRRADFAVYARQDLWVRTPGPVKSGEQALRPATDVDAFAMQALYRSLVPGLIMQVEPPPSAADVCYVLDDSKGGLAGLAAVYHGPRDVLVEIYLHPEVHDLRDTIVADVLDLLDGENTTIYCRLRRYMEWLDDALDEHQFQMTESHAVMARHTAVHISQPAFQRLPARERSIPTTSIEVYRSTRHDSQSAR